MKRVVCRVILIICAVSFCFCGWNIYAYYSDMHQASTSFSKYVTTANASEETAPVCYEEMKAENEDYQGWIWFDSSLISLPVVQSQENNYYLKRNLDGDKSLGGTPFIDAANALTDQNITIYGHTVFMDDSNLVFTPLKQLFDQDTFNNNQRFHIAWQQGIKTYQIFAVCNIDTSTDDWNYTQNIFYTDQEFYAFVRQAKQHSSINVDTDVSAADDLITLQTCTELNSSKRIVVIAKAVKG